MMTRTKVEDMRQERVSADRLKDFCVTVLERAGVLNSHAHIVADSLVEANLRGIDSHGVVLLPKYVKRIKLGLINPKAVPKVVEDTGAIAVVDGDNGLGQVAATKAMEISMVKAREYGVGVVGIRNSNHFGMAAYIAMQAIESEMIGIVLSNAAPSMAPWGGTQPLFGTNPLAVAVPTNHDPIVLDMALGVVARGKIRTAAREGESIPKGWALDEHGNPTTDPQAALKGSVLPIAGPKGYGMALIIDVLSGVLTGSSFADSISSVHETEGIAHVGHFVGAINIRSFMPVTLFKDRISKMIRKVHQSPLAKGVDRIYLPGEIEANEKRKRIRLGVPLGKIEQQQLLNLAEELGIKTIFHGLQQGGGNEKCS